MNFFELDNNLQDIILKVVNKKARDISGNFVSINKDEYQNIFWQLQNSKELARDEFGKPAAAKQANELIHQLNSYLLRNRHKLSNAFLITNPVLIKRPRPPLRQHYSCFLSDIDTLDLQLLGNPDFGYPTQSIKPGSAQQAKFYLGQLLYTAARYGNLLRKDLLSSLFESLRQTAPVQHNNVTWFELSGDANEQYQWIPDPISSALLPRYFQLRYDNQWQQAPMLQQLKWLDCLRYFLRNSSCKSIASLRVKQLFSAFKARYSITHTPCHLNVATGEEPNLSLTKGGFTRLVGYYHAIDLTDMMAEEDDIQIAPNTSAPKAPQQHNEHNLERAITDCSEAIKLVKNVLSDYQSHRKQILGTTTDNDIAKSLKALSKSLRAIAENPNFTLLPITKLLIEWAAMRLVSQNKWSGKLKPNSIATYLTYIFIPMARTFAGHDIVTNLSKSSLLDQPPWNIADLDEYYMEIMDQAPSMRSQLMRAKILRDFHLFLEKAYNIEPSYVCSTMVLKGSKRQPSMVDANILFPHEYQQACDILLKRAKLSLEPASDYIQLVLLVLGFRCGLRRREALFLRESDIQTPGGSNVSISHLTELLVRPFEYRQLKSKAAERRLPLGQLLNQSEIEWFNDFLTLRRQAEQSPYLFSLQTRDKPADADVVFRPLVEQLKLITQDTAFRYHRLRHSFVTWTFWYWQQHKYPNTHPLKPLLQHDVMLHLIKARQHYFNQATNNAIRGELHAVSVMAGHSSPSMTLLHYLHSLHWCQSAEVWRDYSLHQDAIAKLLGLPRRTFFDQKEKRGLVAMLQDAILPWCSSLPDNPQIKTETENEAPQAVEKVNANDIHGFYQALYKFYIDTMLFKAPTPAENENSDDNWCIDDENITPDSLLKHANQQHLWAAQHFANPGQFVNAVNLLKTRLAKKNRARRQQKDKLTGNAYISNTARYELSRWSHKGYASTTAHLIVKAFNTLSEDEKNAALNVAAYIVNDRVTSWNNCQFREPKKLWSFVSQLQPLVKALPPKYYINVDILSRYALNSQERADLMLAWQKPQDISMPPNVNHTVYTDAKGKGYAALTLRTKTSRNSENRQGDHGFYVGMSAIYFYFNSLDKPTAISHQYLRQEELTQHISPEPNWQDDDNLPPVTESMLQRSAGMSIDDLDNLIQNGIERAYPDIGFQFHDGISDSPNWDIDEIPVYEPKPKARRKKQ